MMSIFEINIYTYTIFFKKIRGFEKLHFGLSFLHKKQKAILSNL